VLINCTTIPILYAAVILQEEAVVGVSSQIPLHSAISNDFLSTTGKKHHQHTGRTGPRTILMSKFRQGFGVMTVHVQGHLKAPPSSIRTFNTNPCCPVCRQARYIHQSLHKQGNWLAWFQSNQEDAFFYYDPFRKKQPP
jgi:hypothetical protein